MQRTGQAVGFIVGRARHGAGPVTDRHSAMRLHSSLFSLSVGAALLALGVYAGACLLLFAAGPHPAPLETIDGEWVGLFAGGAVDDPNYLDPRIAFSSFDQRPRGPVSLNDPKAWEMLRYWPSEQDPNVRLFLLPCAGAALAAAAVAIKRRRPRSRGFPVGTS
jgi:hypothetical protein